MFDLNKRASGTSSSGTSSSRGGAMKLRNNRQDVNGGLIDEMHKGRTVEEAMKESIGFQLDDVVDGSKKYPLWKPTKKKKKLRITGYKMVVIDGQEVKVTVYEEEPAYFVGKSPGSGRPTGGSNNADRAQERRIQSYVDHRLNTASKKNQQFETLLWTDIAEELTTDEEE